MSFQAHLMKTILAFLSVIAVSLTGLYADEKGEHAKLKTGPTNGRLLTSVEPHVEFLVRPDKKVELRFVSDANKVVPPSGRVVSVILGDRLNPTKLSFTPKADKLVSDQSIPEGNDHPTVVQIRSKAGAKPVYERFNLDLTKCPSCENPEYSCKCDHEAEAKERAKKK
jgi:hypothetical protein